MVERGYKSIGEVLGLLLEEFPNVTISKIRFLESQGLIEPERTASGYRKFTDAEIDRLRYILREQETNYLPLRVIRDRLDESGAIPRDPTSPVGTLPRSLRERTVVDASREIERITEESTDESGEIEAVDPVILLESEKQHPAARRQPARAPSAPRRDEPKALAAPGGPVSRQDLLETTGLDDKNIDLLEEFGLLSSRTVGNDTFYDGSAREICSIARSFLDLGIEIRHLKAWRLAADKEAALFEQRLMPFLRQRNPEARQQSVEMLESMVGLAGDLRRVLVEQAVHQFLEPR
jgi:DNA-binding transcriptional MerR regulator